MPARSVIFIINIVLLGLFSWGTFEQITTQKETNEVMAKVHDNVKQAHQLTVVTNQKLEPLRETVATIQEMNGKLDRTQTMLANMNMHLSNVAASEQKIVTGLDGLNQNTAKVLEQLNTLTQLNRQLAGPASSVVKQTGQEHGSIEALYNMTETSIRELAELNRKFSLLGYLP